MFGQALVMGLFRDYGILTEICGNHFMVFKLAPPLIVTEAQIDECLTAFKRVLTLAHCPGLFWAEAMGLAGRVINL